MTVNEGGLLMCYLYYYDRVHLTKQPPHFSGAIISIEDVNCEDCLRYYNRRYKKLKQFWRNTK